MGIKFNQKGQTLIELIVALGLIVLVLFSSISLTVLNLQGQKRAEGSLSASQLAREGIELVRNIRDNNWLAITPQWYQGLVDPGGDQNGIIIFEPLSGDLSLDFSVNNINQARLYSHDGYWNHNSLEGRATSYYRLITIEPFCDFCLPPREEIEYACQTDEEPIGLRIVSQVQWQTEQGLKNFQLVDYLYNWK